MQYAIDQIEELKQIAPSVRLAVEGGYTYFLIENFQLPGHCTPKVVDLLFCPQPHTGYNSRLFFSVMPSGIPSRNWNGHVRVLDKTWHAASWQCSTGLRLAELFMIHLKILRP